MTQARGRWPTKSGFLMTAVGAAVGLGGFYDFPVQAIRHGGGAFLIAYLIVLVAVAAPIMTMEFGLGVFYQDSISESLRKIDKRLEWIGWWSIALLVVPIMLCTIMASWSGLYAYDSMLAFLGNAPLPWSSAPEQGAQYFENTYHLVRLEDLGAGLVAVQPIGALVLVMILLWLLVYATLRRGLRGIGALVHVMVPTAIAFILLMTFGLVMQEGALDGIAAYVVPDWSALLSLSTWVAACACAAKSAAIGLGVYVAASSYLNRNADATGSAAIAVLSGGSALFLIGLGMSAALGICAASSGSPVTVEGSDMTHLLFVVLPVAIANLDLAKQWQNLLSILTFLAIAALSVAAIIAFVLAMVTAIVDKYPGISWRQASARTVIGGLLVGALAATNVAPDIFTIAGDFVFPYGIALAALAQCIAVAWVAGAHGLQTHLNAYSVLEVGGFWWLMIAVVAPICLAVSSLAYVIGLMTSGSGGYQFWTLLVLGVLPCLLAVIFSASMVYLPKRFQS